MSEDSLIDIGCEITKSPPLIYDATQDTGRAQDKNSNISFIVEGEEIVRIVKNGRLIWKEREVITDDDFRAAMRDLADKLIIV